MGHFYLVALREAARSMGRLEGGLSPRPGSKFSLYHLIGWTHSFSYSDFQLPWLWAFAILHCACEDQSLACGELSVSSLSTASPCWVLDTGPQLTYSNPVLAQILMYRWERKCSSWEDGRLKGSFYRLRALPTTMLMSSQDLSYLNEKGCVATDTPLAVTGAQGWRI